MSAYRRPIAIVLVTMLILAGIAQPATASAAPHTSGTAATIATVDHVLAISPADETAGQRQDFALPFTNSPGHRLDLRTYYWARAGLTQSRVLVRD
jgi:hypothetical protein